MLIADRHVQTYIYIEREIYMPGAKKVGGLTSWSVQLDSPGTALTVGGWIRPWGQN